MKPQVNKSTTHKEAKAIKAKQTRDSYSNFQTVAKQMATTAL